MSDISNLYLHGFSSNEQRRLFQQAEYIAPMIYPGIDFQHCHRILEIGSGVGAQTEILLRLFPHIHVTCLDMNDGQLKRAAQYLDKISHAKGRYELHQQDANHLNFSDNSFDGIFLCWILEHLAHPKQVLKEALRVLRPGAKLYANEVMNSSFFVFPHKASLGMYWGAYNHFQSENGGDPYIGAKLGGFLHELGYNHIQTLSKCMHFDKRDPKGRIQALGYWRDLLLSGANQLQECGAIPADLPDGVRDDFASLERCADSVLYYAFIQASAVKP